MPGLYVSCIDEPVPAIGIAIYAGIILILVHGAAVLPLIVLFILTSLSGSLLFPSFNALVVDVTSPEDRMRAYSIFRILSNSGWAIGPIAGSFLFDHGIVWIFSLVLFTLVVQLLIIIFLIKDRRIRSQSARAGLRAHFSELIVFDRMLMIFSVGTFLLMILTSQFSVTLPTYAVARTHVLSDQLGYIYAINGLVVVLGQFPSTVAVRRLKDESVVMLGAAFYMLGFFLIAFSYSLLQLMGDMVLITIGENLTAPGMNSMVSKLAPEDRVGRYMAFNGIANSAGRAMGPTAGSILLFIFAFDGIKVWSSLDMFGLMSILIMAYLLISGKRGGWKGARASTATFRR